MTSRRPTTKPANIDFSHEALKDCFVTEPQRGQSTVAAMEKTALSSTTMNLMEQVVHWSNMQKAWKAVRANHGAPGPDGITINDFPNHFYQHWPRIWRQLLDGTYQPGASRRKSIEKKDGGERLLGIPNVMERLICQAISQVLTPIFDPAFSESSYGYRPKRSASGAIKQIQRNIRDGYRHCLDMDLSKFFDRCVHDALLARVARKVDDKRLLKLIGRFLRAGVIVDGQLQPTHEGVMQGSPLSPLLSNILLDDFDKVLEKRGLRFVRYADDFLIFTRTAIAAQRVFRSVEKYLTRKLKLVVKQSIKPDIKDRLEFSTKVAGILVLGFSVAAVTLVGFMFYDPSHFASTFPEVSSNEPQRMTEQDDLFGSTTDVPSSGVSVEEGRTQFLTVVPVLKDARQQRASLVAQTKTAIDASLLEVSTAINATNFADAMLGWESTYQGFQGSKAQREWVESKFVNEVIDVNDVLSIVRTRLQTLKRDVFELDRELLAIVHRDSSCIPERFIDFTPMVDELRKSAISAIDNTISTASYAPLETIGSTLVSYVAGFLAEQVTRENGAVTSKGNPTLGTQRMAAGAGLATGFGVDYAVQEIFGSAPGLKQTIEQTLKGSFDRLRLHGSLSYLWQSAIDEYVWYEQSAVESAFFDAANVSPEWANIQLQ